MSDDERDMARYVARALEGAAILLREATRG